jgi:opacity protein-like surface antigen
MTRPNGFALATTIALCLWGTANPAHATPGPYATAVFGLANQSDQSLTLSGTGPTQRGNAALDSGGLAGGALGYGFDNGWRIEGEFIYQSVDSETTGFTPAALTGDGNFASTSVALNAIYGFDIGGSPDITTYVGAGFVRLTEVDIDIEQGGNETSFSGSGNAFQLLFGARYDLGERWYVDAGLRWLRASSLDLDREDGPSARIEADYEPWAVTVGIGWRF